MLSLLSVIPVLPMLFSIDSAEGTGLLETSILLLASPLLKTPVPIICGAALAKVEVVIAESLRVFATVCAPFPTCETDSWRVVESVMAGFPGAFEIDNEGNPPFPTCELLTADSWHVVEEDIAECPVALAADSEENAPFLLCELFLAADSRIVEEGVEAKLLGPVGFDNEEEATLPTCKLFLATVDVWQIVFAKATAP